MSDSAIKSVNHALDIMEFLYRFGQEASISEISAATGMFGSTVYRQLTTLKERGVVEKNASNSRYWLSHKFYEVVAAASGAKTVVNTLFQGVDELAKKYSQQVFVAIPDFTSDSYAHYIVKYSKSCRKPRKGDSIDGMILMAHTSVVGRCLMAYYPEGIIDRYSKRSLPRVTESGIIAWDQLKAELSLIRKRGYALETDPTTDDTSIAVPALDENGALIAAICISGTSDMLFNNPLRMIVGDLKAVASVIAEKK